MWKSGSTTQHDVVGAHRRRRQRVHLLDARPQRAVAEHRALRPPARARGVHQQRERLGVHVGFVRHAGERPEGHLPRRRGTDHDAQERSARVQVGRLARGRRGGAVEQQGARPAVGDHPAPALRSSSPVLAGTATRPARSDAEVRRDELRGVGQRKDDPVAGEQPEPLQARRGSADADVDLLPRERAPLGQQRDVVATLARRRPHQIGQVGAHRRSVPYALAS